MSSFLEKRKLMYNNKALRENIVKNFRVTEKEYLMGRDAQYPLSEEQKLNMFLLLCAVNVIRDICEIPMVVTSGYRPGHFNKATKGATRSTHLSCEGIDIRDTNKAIGQWCLENVSILEALGVYVESLDVTHKGPGLWVHLQIRPTRNRFFLP
jgi:uncharacterized protein YcbK (DUF882 family)